ncbi:hypothetical protein BXZ70DRAFT_907198 [Cristinia sonorae]|uniref:DinB-like domain-containing protein n=1 Tax=Cristinia sonorae TaxID=1940300 RepID=A0A8K0UPE5_9AGAR|nr:hypothetical protein BXZ70DRAFT_907198 [Cristinia sonorae]
MPAAIQSPLPLPASNGADSSASTYVDEAKALERLIEVSSVVLAQAVDLVDNSLVSDEQMTAKSQYIPGSTIVHLLTPTEGKHLRHARDHFMLLMDSVSTSAPHVLNYDVRSRNTPMETSRKDAHDALSEAIARLKDQVPLVHLDEPITLHAVTPYPQVVQTTFGRELWFAALHAVHHWSMVRVVAGELGIALEETFGFAPSTLVHQGSEGPLGKPKI